MSKTAEELTNRLNSAEGAGLQPALWLPLMKLLANGKPVDAAELAAVTGRPADDVCQALAAISDTEYDEDGRIVGQGLTQRPTRHRFSVDGVQLYTWCALDTLLFPSLLDKTAVVESVSPTSGTPVRVRVGADAVTHVEPATAVVSLINPDDMSSVRSAFCNQVHFFASADDAQPWLENHPDGEVMSVEDAYRLANTMAMSMLEQRSASRGNISQSCC
ncbi:organomercurial lyase MerB [Blastococcus goldschmidtiae]|uniref:Alkylmercury lyase n=1 Tax=Blastococcus goldschmidtiae TaxID=3075546 RepID=A0ABU2KDG9_9ACTN|nr:organomercurial lyase MerB [Blastococcus sp. DSM 46792]MDT0278236.1 organomercurial lyase MerB [Blastococcus sp. DSM 46792]